MKTMEINGEIFEVTRPREKHVVDHVTGGTLMDYYERPSIYKQEIYSDWIRWAFDTMNNHPVEFLDYMCVTGANCMTFSMGALVLINGTKYVMRITKDHNRLIECL